MDANQDSIKRLEKAITDLREHHFLVCTIRYGVLFISA